MAKIIKIFPKKLNLCKVKQIWVFQLWALNDKNNEKYNEDYEKNNLNIFRNETKS